MYRITAHQGTEDNKRVFTALFILWQVSKDKINFFSFFYFSSKTVNPVKPAMFASLLYSSLYVGVAKTQQINNKKSDVNHIINQFSEPKTQKARTGNILYI